MSSNLMDTAPGGESNPYEESNVFNKPHDKLTGQLGASSDKTREPSSSITSASSKPAGNTTSKVSGEKNTTEAQDGARRAEGYDKSNEMDRQLGA